MNSNSEVPLCPRPGSYISGLGNTYPTGAVFVALEPGNSIEVVSEIYRFLTGHGEIPTKLNLVVSDKNIKHIRNNATPELLDILNDTKNVNVIPIDYPYGEIRWTQDWLSFVYSKGEPAILRLTYRGDTENAKKERIKNRDVNPSAQVAKSCQMPTINHSLFGTDFDQGSLEETMGGNFNVIAGSVWGIGLTSRIENIEQQKNVYSYGKPTSWPDWAVRAAKTYRAQVETIKSNGDKILQVNTDIAPVGHFDELFNVIKTPRNKCGFVILSASAELGIKILESMSQNDVTDSAGCEEDGGFAETDPKFLERIEENKRKNCIGFSKIKIDDFLKDEDSRKFSQEFQNIMNENEDLISHALMREGVCDKVDFVRIPVLVKGRVGTQPFKHVSPQKYLLPNPVNGLVLTPLNGASTFLYGKTYFEPFDVSISKALSNTGIHSKPIYAPLYWQMGGGIHCGTNALPICREQ